MIGYFLTVLAALLAANAAYTAGTYYRLGRICAELDHHELRLVKLETAR